MTENNFTLVLNVFGMRIKEWMTIGDNDDAMSNKKSNKQ